MDPKLSMRLQQGLGFPEFDYSQPQNGQSSNQNETMESQENGYQDQMYNMPMNDMNRQNKSQFNGTTMWAAPPVYQNNELELDNLIENHQQDRNGYMFADETQRQQNMMQQPQQQPQDYVQYNYDYQRPIAPRPQSYRQRFSQQFVSQHHTHTHTPEVEDHFARIRARYKAKSSVPLDLSTSKYAEQCIAAAKSCRLPPFSLHTQEYNLLRPHLPYAHVTTYLNIRNAICRLWLSNPMVMVTMTEAAGVCREERYYGLAEVAFHFLVRYGYINFGCVEHYRPEIYSSIPEEEKKPRQTIVIIGAGIAGLGSARQLDALLKRYAHYFTEYEDVPRVIVLEGRRRIGGRIYSAPLKTDHDSMVDLGAQLVMGFGKGNPLAVLVRRQLGLPVLPVEPYCEIYDSKRGTVADGASEDKMHNLFKHVMDRMNEFKSEIPSPNTANGDEVLMRAAKDYTTGRDDEYEMQTIAKLEENGELAKPYDNPGKLQESKYDKYPETKLETDFLQQLGVRLKTNKSKVHVAPEPQGEMYPSLGHTMDSMVKQLNEIAELTEEDMRLLNWHYANYEYLCGAGLDKMSLSSWNQDQGNEFEGRYSMIETGYQSLTRGLYVYPDKLDVRFKTSVKVVEYNDDKSHVFLENGERIEADRVLCTVPLGVLKERSIQFIPDLPQWKTDSIERLGFGVMNKVCLVFDRVFWDDSKDVVCVAQEPNGDAYDPETYKESRGQFYMFLNVTKQIGKPCLVGLITGNAAQDISNESDDAVINAACQTLRRVLQMAEFNIVESIVTRWQLDPFARGAYSYIGVEATGADYDLMGRPVGQSLFFAGEATCRARPGTVHGAYISGLRAANEILKSMIGDVEMPYPLIPTKEQHVFGNRIHSAPPGQMKYPMRNSMTPPETMQQQAVLGRPPMVRGQSNASQLSTGSDVATVNDPSPLKRKAGNSPADSSGMATPSSMQEIEDRLKELKEQRELDDNEKMRSDMTKELGHRPVKPERSGANPFLIFQKDFWEICREECDSAKQESSGDPKAKAARNEVRAALGKKWRELPADKKQPYLEATKEIKETNNRNLEEYRQRSKVYDADAEDFRKRWREEKASKPSEEEQRLQQLVQEQKDKDRRSRKRQHH